MHCRRQTSSPNEAAAAPCRNALPPRRRAGYSVRWQTAAEARIRAKNAHPQGRRHSSQRCCWRQLQLHSTPKAPQSAATWIRHAIRPDFTALHRHHCRNSAFGPPLMPRRCVPIAQTPPRANSASRQHKSKIAAHAFRGTFRLSRIPAATLYVAGPRSMKTYRNGKVVLDTSFKPTSRVAGHVFSANVHSALRIGRNLLAIQAVRGWGAVAASDVPAIHQLAHGKIIVAKIVPAAWGVNAKPLVITGVAQRGRRTAGLAIARLRRSQLAARTGARSHRKFAGFLPVESRCRTLRLARLQGHVTLSPHI